MILLKPIVLIEVIGGAVKLYGGLKWQLSNQWVNLRKKGGGKLGRKTIFDNFAGKGGHLNMN